MDTNYWLNLPVADVAKSIAFFKNLGFSFNDKHTTTSSACLLIGKNMPVIMLFEKSLFASFIVNTVTDINMGNEVLVSLGASSPEEVDEMAKKVSAANGTIYSPPQSSQGWMYGFAFIDLDGHRWNMLYMNQDARPK